jgi:hypothetical protein
VVQPPLPVLASVSENVVLAWPDIRLPLPQALERQMIQFLKLLIAFCCLDWANGLPPEEGEDDA